MGNEAPSAFGMRGVQPTLHPNSTTSPFSSCGKWLAQPVYTGTSMGNVIATVLEAVTQTTLLIVLWYRRRQLSRDAGCCSSISNSSGIATHLLPVHILLLRASVAIYIIQALTLLIPGLGEVVDPTGSDGDHILSCIVKGLVWGAQHVIVDGIGILLVQPGIGRRALRHVMMLALPWGVVTAVVVSFSCYFKNDDVEGNSETWILAGYYFVHASAYFIVGFTSCLWWAPCRQKRPAFRIFALGWIILRLMAIGEDFIAYVDDDAATCLNFCTVRASFMVAIPILIYVVFREDTAFWYGLAYTYSAEDVDPHILSTEKRIGNSGRRTTDELKDSKIRQATIGEKVATFFENSGRKISISQKSRDDIRRPLLGIHLPDSAIETMSKGIETLDRKAVISFAELSLDMASMVPVLLGAGSTAKVYRGTWRRRVPVAFKLVFAPDINKDTIEAFFKEAAILRSLEHPNIVRFMGVCVAPPTLAHVLELCDGTLYDAIQARRASCKKKKSDFVGSAHLEWFHNTARQCASAVAFLHSRTPMPVLHRDIKSLNFLTIGDKVKLADMDLAIFWTDDSSTEGESSDVTESETDSENKYSFSESGIKSDYPSSLLAQATSSVHSVSVRGEYGSGGGRNRSTGLRRSQSAHIRKPGARFLRRLGKRSWRKYSQGRRKDETHNVFDIVGTVQWAAPEVLRRLPGSSRKEADVYALAVVWWECLALSSPFQDISTQEVIKLVVSGQRLVLPRETPPHLAALFKQCWSEEPANRPSAEELERIVSSFEYEHS